jgi:flagellar basal body-associated protein FliL
MKKIVIIVVPVVVLLLGAVAFLMLRPSGAPVDEAALAKEPGPTHAIADPFIVNLADTDSPHFAKIAIALEVSKLSAAMVPAEGHGSDPVAIEGEAEIRDIIISTIQKFDSGELAHASGRTELKETLVKRINKETELKITEVFFTDFAVQ